jgi:hypothetical protein
MRAHCNAMQQTDAVSAENWWPFCTSSAPTRGDRMKPREFVTLLGRGPVDKDRIGHQSQDRQGAWSLISP